MSLHRRLVIGMPCLVLLLAATTADAQPLGTFRWQLQPFCNVVVVNVTQQGAIYQVDGFDDQCGAAQRAPLVGMATPNPDGSIGFGLNIVTAPGGRDVHVDARISLPGLGGTWSDSSGNTGTFAFSGSTAGSPRPPASLGAIAVNSAQVQLRVTGACPVGQVMVAVNQSGAVECDPGLKTTANGGFDFRNAAGLVASIDPQGGGTIAAEGPGRRFLYFAGQDAFRVGQVTGTQWDAVNIGRRSVAMGSNTVASGNASFAMGGDAVASGSESVAMGKGPVASGFGAVAMGLVTTAAGDGSVALGSNAVAQAAADGSFVFADRSAANPFTSFAPNEFVARAAGGVGFYTNAATTTGVELAPNGSSWASLSDANAKENFRDVDGEDVLSKLAAMSIQEWNYKAQDAAIRHMGPTAQEFRAAFGLGDFPLRINTIDADGVALAAVKALEARTRAMPQAADVARLQAANADLRTENANLRARLDRLEALLKAQ